MIFLYISTSTLYAVYDVEDSDYEAKAIKISDILISTPGYPADWEMGTYSTVEDLGEIKRLGLALEDASYGVLYIAKIQFLQELQKQHDEGYFDETFYYKFKESLGLDEWYDFHITITEFGETTPILSFGKSYDSANLSSLKIVKEFTRNIGIFQPSYPNDILEASLRVLVFR
jgi:hypothetical protein